MELKNVAKSAAAEVLVELIEEVQAEVLNVRFKPEIPNEARVAFADLLDEKVIERIKRFKNSDDSVGQSEWE